MSVDEVTAATVDVAGHVMEAVGMQARAELEARGRGGMVRGWAWQNFLGHR